MSTRCAAGQPAHETNEQTQSSFSEGNEISTDHPALNDDLQCIERLSLSGHGHPHLRLAFVWNLVQQQCGRNRRLAVNIWLQIIEGVAGYSDFWVWGDGDEDWIGNNIIDPISDDHDQNAQDHIKIYPAQFRLAISRLDQCDWEAARSSLIKRQVARPRSKIYINDSPAVRIRVLAALILLSPPNGSPRRELWHPDLAPVWQDCALFLFRDSDADDAQSDVPPDESECCTQGKVILMWGGIMSWIYDPAEVESLCVKIGCCGRSICSTRALLGSLKRTPRAYLLRFSPKSIASPMDIDFERQPVWPAIIWVASQAVTWELPTTVDNLLHRISENDGDFLDLWSWDSDSDAWLRSCLSIDDPDPDCPPWVNTYPASWRKYISKLTWKDWERLRDATWRSPDSSTTPWHSGRGRRDFSRLHDIKLRVGTLLWIFSDAWGHQSRLSELSTEAKFSSYMGIFWGVSQSLTPFMDEANANNDVWDNVMSYLSEDILSIDKAHSFPMLDYVLANVGQVTSLSEAPGTWSERNTTFAHQQGGGDFASIVDRFECVRLVRQMNVGQGFVVYTLAHLMRCTDNIRLLNDLRSTLESWKIWKGLHVLENYLGMNETLWNFLRRATKIKMSPDSSGAASIVQKLLAFDIDGVCAQLAMVLQDRDGYRTLLAQRGRTAQSFLDLFQALLDYPQLALNLKTPLITALIRLSKNSALYPECLALKGMHKVGKYPVAAGNFGEIRKGRIQGQCVAIKVVKLYLESDDMENLLKESEFSREAVIWRQLLHPNILPFYGVYHLDDDHSRICLVSPWMEHGNVDQFLKQAPETNRALLTLDVAEGLAYLHDNNVVHGDLKAVNILITPACKACLADFGLSSVTDSNVLRWTSLSTATPKGGTARWLAPELLLGAQSNKASDVYAFAHVCYEIFTGNYPFHELVHDAAVILKVMQGTRPSRPSVGQAQGLTDRIWDLVEDCWKAAASERPTSSEVVQQLQNIINPAHDHRPKWNWDESFPFRLRTSLREHPFYPSVDDIETILFEKSVGSASQNDIPDTPRAVLAPTDTNIRHVARGVEKRPLGLSAGESQSPETTTKRIKMLSSSVQETSNKHTLLVV